MEHQKVDTQKSSGSSVLSVLLKIVLTLAAGAAILFGGSFVILVLMSADVFLPFAYIGGWVLPALLLPVIWLKRRKKYMKIWLIAAAVFLVVLGANFGLTRYDRSISINTSANDYAITAEDPFVFIVHKDNPVHDLTVEQLRGIYSGAITNWNEVGGANQKIKAYQSEPGSGNQTMMEHFMGETALMKAPSEMGYGYLYAWGEQVSAYRNKPASIGFCFAPYVQGNPDVKALSVDGIAPTQENLRNGSYPILAPDFVLKELE